MKFLLYLPFAGKSGTARIGFYSRNHEHGGRLIYKGQPLDVDPFNPESVRRFNEVVRKEMESAFELGRAIYPLPPRLEMLVVPEPTPEPAPVKTQSMPVEEESSLPEPVATPAPVMGPRRPGRPPKVRFPEPAFANENAS